MQRWHGEKALILDSGCPNCGSMLIIYALDGTSLGIGIGKSETGCV